MESRRRAIDRKSDARRDVDRPTYDINFAPAVSSSDGRHSMRDRDGAVLSDAVGPIMYGW